MNEPFLSLPIAKGIPEKRARFLFRVRSEKSHPDDEQLAATQSHGVLSQKRYMEMTGNKVVAALAGTDNFNHVEQDDFVISLRTFEGGIERATESGCISPAYTVLAPLRGVEPGFFHYLLKSKVFISHLQTTVTGIRDGKSVKFENFANIVLPHPGLETQRRIADFLDRETARIDLLIEKKQQLLALLEEKVRSDIHGLFQSLDAETWRIRHLGKVKNGAGFPVDLQGDPSNEIPFFKVKNLAANGLDQRIAASDDTITKETARTLGASVFPAGTIVFAKIGAALLLGRFSMLGTEGCIDNNLAAFVVNKRLVDPDYLLLCLERFDMQLMVQPGAVPSLSTEKFINRSVPLPSLEGQRGLVELIRREVQRNGRIVQRTQVSIDRLKEYRSALITAAVTGQIDVASHSRSGATELKLDALQEEMDA
ncbi:restriction endonuclease subunit S [Aliiroseovarius crassostreae]|uniref:Restriction endonuclease subunit S n=1 Tax=Aliiroseovarius crassostreae TaxID=154981 RepID=A0A9Q9M0G0_9RHOB|nr:restriction endonuclease subunit S [Aliiroseovarius crassostreae]UWP96468.1 restriction endonuclease subunit S [Aliiroseovarius crassostreae]